MIFKEYLAHLNKLAEKWPEALDWPVVYSRDDEGNGFQQVVYSPNIGKFEGHEFLSIGDTQDPPNSVCLN